MFRSKNLLRIDNFQRKLTVSVLINAINQILTFWEQLHLYKLHHACFRISRNMTEIIYQWFSGGVISAASNIRLLFFYVYIISTKAKRYSESKEYTYVYVHRHNVRLNCPWHKKWRYSGVHLYKLNPSKIVSPSTTHRITQLDDFQIDYINPSWLKVRTFL